MLLRLLLISTLMLSACGNKERKMDDLIAVKARLAFTCADEKDRSPPLPADADILFKYARYLQKYNTHNPQEQEDSINVEIERLYRIAAAHGHYKASINLQNGRMRGQFHGAFSDMVDRADELIKRNIPAGYFLMAMYIKNGVGGIKKDEELALRYFRKAADLGSPEAQYYVGDKLADISIAPEVAIQMWQCAAKQGNGDAATALGIWRKEPGTYPDAVKAFQLGVIAGDESAASFLANGFNGPDIDNRLYYLGVDKDDERAKRYKAIGDMLTTYYFVSPKPTVPEIEQIVPLPPAKLPAWDGTFQWLKEYEAKVAPEKPSDELIKRLADEKGLNPETGLIDPAKVAAMAIEKAEDEARAERQRIFEADLPEDVALGTVLKGGDRCPRRGIWLCSPAPLQGPPQRAIKDGMKLFDVVAYVPAEKLVNRLLRRQYLAPVPTTWTLVAYLPHIKRGQPETWDRDAYWLGLAKPHERYEVG